MEEKKSKKLRKHSDSIQAVSRRKSAVERLENQLKNKQKNTNDGAVELTEIDTKRINREIAILKTRI